MSKNFMKTIEKIVQSSGNSRISLMTQYLKIEGDIFIPNGKCEECNDEYLTLQNALVCRLKDYCECSEDDCKCNDYVCFRYEWLHIAENKIVAFSIV